MPPSRRPEPVPPPVYRRSNRPLPGRPHHGSWKVAYADFVTALMCLFIVLWLTGSTQTVKKSISGYFRDPKAYASKLERGSTTPADIRRLLEQAIQRMPDFESIRENIQFSITAEGLRIEMMENAQGTFFVAGSAQPSTEGSRLLRVLAEEIARIPNRIAIEGHSDAQPFRNSAPQSGYGNWELSADRANAARRILHTSGVRPEQVAEVRGFADQKLLNENDPNDPRNRRVSVVVKFE